MYTVAASQVVGHLPGGLGVGGHPSVAENVLDATTTAVQPSFKVCACVYVCTCVRQREDTENERESSCVQMFWFVCMHVCVCAFVCYCA